MNMNDAFQNLNWLAIVVAAVSSFLIGGLWFSPLMFVNRWMKEAGIKKEDNRNKNMVKVFGVAFILSLIASFFLAMFIGKEAGAAFGAIAGFMAGFGWILTYVGIIYLFESRSFVHFMINAGYSVVSLTVMGLIVGAWQ
jgi:MFS family permease